MSERALPPAAAKVLALFEEGRRFTEDLLQENERLRASVAGLKSDKRTLERRIAGLESDEASKRLALLDEEVGLLRAENLELREQFAAMEVENREFADRYVEVERQHSDLLNLYVATYRLHATRDPVELLATIKEIVVNMVGSECFGVYVADVDPRRLVLVDHVGLEERGVNELSCHGAPCVGVFEERVTYVAPQGGDAEAQRGEPIAIIPLQVDEQVLGVIAIYELLVQKQGFADVDLEIFELLAGQAATALASSVTGAGGVSLSELQKLVAAP